MTATDRKNYTSIYTDEQTREILVELSEKLGVSRSEVVRQAVVRMSEVAAEKREKEIRSLVHRLAELIG